VASIITITLNPAIDKSTRIETVLPDKKLRCSLPRFEPGGGGVNVARALKKLGDEATAYYLAGGYTGKFFTQLLEKENVPTHVIEISRHTRENLIVLETSTRHQYRFGMPGPEIQEQEWKQLLIELEKTDEANFWIASGSVPRGVPVDIFARMANMAKKKKIKFIADTSGEALKHVAMAGVYLLKPNIGELSFIAGKKWMEPDDIIPAARKIITDGNCEMVVVSMGESGALLVTRDVAIKAVPPRVEKKSTVGAGDSMVAGLVWSLANGKSLKETLLYGIACGTAATMNPGTELCNKEDADKLYTQLHESCSSNQ
jgi:6-phosphofructokinase 2